MKALATAGLVLLGMLLGSTPAASAQASPPTLSAESLAGTTITATTSGCNPTGTSSTFTYQTSGLASGPYNGSFTETGTVTIGPQPIVPGVFSAPGGLVTGWTASFTITSTAPIVATISGTKTLLPPPTGSSPDVAGICEDGNRGISPFPNFPPQTAANNLPSHQLLAYTATITLSDGTQFRDTGTSRAIEGTTPLTPQANQFSENYVSQQTATVPICDQNFNGQQDQDADDQGCVNP